MKAMVAMVATKAMGRPPDGFQSEVVIRTTKTSIVPPKPDGSREVYLAMVQS